MKITLLRVRKSSVHRSIFSCSRLKCENYFPLTAFRPYIQSITVTRSAIVRYIGRFGADLTVGGLRTLWFADNMGFRDHRVPQLDKKHQLFISVLFNVEEENFFHVTYTRKNATDLLQPVAPSGLIQI